MYRSITRHIGCVSDIHLLVYVDSNMKWFTREGPLAPVDGIKKQTQNNPKNPKEKPLKPPE